MSEYVPTVGELRQAYVEASGASMAQESYYAEQVAEFERGIARIKAAALREALLSDESVERAARAIARAENADYWAEEIDRWEQSEEWERKAYPDEYPGMAYEDRGQFREAARAALTAALGIEGVQ